MRQCRPFHLGLSVTKLGSHMFNALYVFRQLFEKYVRRICFHCANKRWSILCYIKRLFAFHTDFSRIFQSRISCAIFSSPAFSRPAFLCHIFRSRIFQPYSFVPYFPFLHFPALHFSLCRIFMSRIFSRPTFTTHRVYIALSHYSLQHWLYSARLENRFLGKFLVFLTFGVTGHRITA